MAFSIFKRIFGGKKQVPEPDPDEPGRYVYQSASTLTAIPAAYAAIGLLSETLAKLPRTVARIEDVLDDYWEPDLDHPVSALLWHPSRMVDPWVFWEWLFRCLFGTGNAYAWIRRDRSYRPVELVPAECTRCEWVASRRGPVAEYDLTLWGAWDGGGARELRGVRAGDVLTLHGPGFSGLASPSPVQYAARRTLEVMDEAATHQQSLLRAGGGARTAIETDKELLALTPEQRKQHRQDLQDSYTKARKEGRIPVLPPGFNAASTGGMSAVDIQVIEVLRWSVEDVARVWNVPPRLLHHYHEGFRVAAFEAQAADWERNSISGHVQRVQEQLSAKLMSRDDVEMSLAVRMPTDRIRAGNWSERVSSVDQAVAKAGVMSINEGRRQLRLPDWPGGDRLLQPKGAPAQDVGGESG